LMFGVSAGSAVKPVGMLPIPGDEPAAKRLKTTSVWDDDEPPAQKKTWGAVPGKPGYYQDLVWTPMLAAARKAEAKKDARMARALVNAMEQQPERCVTLSAIGGDFEVSKLKKDYLYKGMKLVDIIKRYEELFEINSDLMGGGFSVMLKSDARVKLGNAGLEDSGTFNGQRLPDRIDNPTNTRDKMQALRIELLLAVCRRGGKCPVTDLGQEPRVQRLKQGLTQAKKLLDFVKIFPNNFHVGFDPSPLNPQQIVQVVSADCNDREQIDISILKQHQARLESYNNNSIPGRSIMGSFTPGPSRGFGGDRGGGKGGFSDRGFSDRGFSGGGKGGGSSAIQAAWRDAAAAAVAQAQAYAQAAQYGAELAKQLAAGAPSSGGGSSSGFSSL